MIKNIECMVAILGGIVIAWILLSWVLTYLFDDKLFDWLWP